MDGGSKQAKIYEQVKQEIKIKARQRRGESLFQTLNNFTIIQPNSAQDSADLKATAEATIDTATDLSLSRYMPAIGQEVHRNLQQEQTFPNVHEIRQAEGSDAVLSLFYLEKVLPFLFPFYNPSLLQGGKAWILDMITTRPAIREPIFCQSSYFALASESANDNGNWQEVVTQSRTAFGTLRQSLQMINNLDIERTLPCTVRVMASIVQVHRFEITILNFTNWQTHLNAVVGLFKQLLDSDSSFFSILDRLGSPLILPVHNTPIPNAEQAAFRFSSTLVIWDDIIASTILQTRPKLYHYHQSLLCSNFKGGDPPINMESVFGVRNWAMVQIAEIATLDAWKLDCIKAGTLDVMQLVVRGTTIKESLLRRLTELENELPQGVIGSLESFTFSNVQSSQGTLITRVWTHAAFLYLFIVISGWQPANEDVRYHVSRLIDLLLYQISPVSLLRSVAWPFCVAGCLAELAQEPLFRRMILGLPPTLFGKLHKALEIMEIAWKERNTGYATTHDLAACFKSLQDPIILV
jgi:hypothetical protein